MLRYKENLGYYLKKAANELLKNNLSEAFKIYSRILIEIPNFTDALYGMYKVYLKEKNMSKAAQFLKSALLNLGITYSFNPHHRKVFKIWAEEYRSISTEPVYITLSKNIDPYYKQKIKNLFKKKRI